MSALPAAIPSRVPDRGAVSVSSTTLMGADPYSLFDVAIGGVGFQYANSVDNPMQRVTIQPNQVQDQPRGAAETTTTDWLVRGQSAFHGGAGQLQYEPDVPGPYTPVRYFTSKNVDPFTPGYVTRLPDTTLLRSVTSTTALTALSSGGKDCVAWVAAGAPQVMLDATGTQTVSNLTGMTGALSVCTDGTYVYAANGTTVMQWDPAVPASPKTIASWSTASTDTVVGWVKSRLMLAHSGVVYEVTDLSGANPATAPQLRYTHPAVGFSWKCFANGPQALLAAGNAPGGASTITSFTLNAQSSGAPTLQVAGDIGEMPFGEHILSMLLVGGSLLVVGTDKGIRVGTYDSYYGRLTIGPLNLSPDMPVLPAYALASRDNRVYAAGRDYDEAGLMCLNLGVTVDQAGRFAWAPHLVTNQFTSAYATTVTMLPLSQRIVFGVPGTGLWLEGVGAGSGRESWIQTSRIRYSTTEPKLFKLGRVRGYFQAGTVQVVCSTADDPLETVATAGFVTSDPDEFKLPSAPTEWMQLKMVLTGSSTVLYSWSVKSRPGERRQRRYRLVLSLYDRETTKNGQEITNELSSRSRLAALEELDAEGDQVLLQEFTPSGVVATVVQIEEVNFSQVTRPTGTSDLGGTVTVTVRTVES